MSDLGPLSSQIGQRSEAVNREAVGRCLANPALLDEAAFRLGNMDAPVVGDSAEVMTMVALVAPGLVAPFAERLVWAWPNGPADHRSPSEARIRFDQQGIRQEERAGRDSCWGAQRPSCLSGAQEEGLTVNPRREGTRRL